MIVIKSSTDKVKTEMKKATAAITDEIKEIKAKYKKEKVKVLPKEAEAKIEGLEHRKDMYSVSKILPVCIDGLIINFKLYETFMEKIKDFQIDIKVTNEHVQIDYQKGKAQGTLVLEDMSPYFNGFVHVPVGEVDHGS